MFTIPSHVWFMALFCPHYWGPQTSQLSKLGDLKFSYFTSLRIFRMYKSLWSLYHSVTQATESVTAIGIGAKATDMARATAAMERIVAAGRKFRARGPQGAPGGPLGLGPNLGIEHREFKFLPEVGSKHVRVNQPNMFFQQEWRYIIGYWVMDRMGDVLSSLNLG